MKLKPPQVENLPRGEHVFPQDDLLVNRLRLEGADWSYQSAAGMSLDQVVLVKAVLDGCILERARILDLEVLESAAAGVQLLESSVVRSAFTGCRMFGVQFGGAELKQVSFKDSKLAQASFRCAKMEGVLFRECDLTDETSTAPR